MHCQNWSSICVESLICTYGCAFVYLVEDVCQKSVDQKLKKKMNHQIMSYQLT